MKWKKWVQAVEKQGIDDETEMSFIEVNGGYYPEVTIHRPDPEDSDYKVADVTQGEHENDMGFGLEFTEADTGEFPVFINNIP